MDLGLHSIEEILNVRSLDVELALASCLSVKKRVYKANHFRGDGNGNLVRIQLGSIYICVSYVCNVM